jgi:ADP-ribose pyrophosphatase
MNFKVLKHSVIYAGRVFSTVVDDVEYESGRESKREVAVHPGGATVLPVFPDRRVLMIKQHRYPLGKFIWELPAGKLEPNEDPLECAKRELEEETGYSARTWKKITSIYTSPGFCTEVLHLYLATELSELPTGRRLEEGELTMTLHMVPLDEAKQMIKRGEILDAKSIISILMGADVLDGHSS